MTQTFLLGNSNLREPAGGGGSPSNTRPCRWEVDWAWPRARWREGYVYRYIGTPVIAWRRLVHVSTCVLYACIYVCMCGVVMYDVCMYHRTA